MKPFLTSAECGDIAITAAEGGIGYWSQIDRYDWKRWTAPDEFVGESITVPSDFVYYSIREYSELTGQYADPLIDITPALIKRGFDLLRKSGRKFYDDDPSMMDADEADLVIQYGVFGKVVYG